MIQMQEGEKTGIGTRSAKMVTYVCAHQVIAEQGGSEAISPFVKVPQNNSCLSQRGMSENVHQRSRLLPTLKERGPKVNIEYVQNAVAPAKIGLQAPSRLAVATRDVKVFFEDNWKPAQNDISVDSAPN